MLDKITNTCLEKIILELNKPTNKEKLYNNVVNPLFINLSHKLLPYILFFFILFIFNLILIIVILILIIYNKN